MPESKDTKRRRGGQELPESAQDRPEQNRGYDEAVRGGPSPAPSSDDLDDVVQLELLPDDDRASDDDRAPDDDSAPDVSGIDDDAARRAAADVRRRERRSR